MRVGGVIEHDTDNIIVQLLAALSLIQHAGGLVLIRTEHTRPDMQHFLIRRGFLNKPVHLFGAVLIAAPVTLSLDRRIRIILCLRLLLRTRQRRSLRLLLGFLPGILLCLFGLGLCFFRCRNLPGLWLR